MPTPTLSTQNLELAPYYAFRVLDQHIAWLNDPEVVQYSENRHKTHDIISQHIYLNGYDRTHQHIWLIRVANRDIGTISANIDTHNGVADMGILIGEKACWKHGYGTEAWMGIMDWLWSQNVRKIEGGCMEVNKPMRALFRKVGMFFDCTKSLHFVHNGIPCDALFYGIFRP